MAEEMIPLDSEYIMPLPKVVTQAVHLAAQSKMILIIVKDHR